MSDPVTILVAEDNDFVRMQLVRFLEEGGYTTREAKDGTGALAIMKAESIGAALLDVRMEPMDGFELIKAMDGANLTCPIIMVTGDNNPDLLSEAARGRVSAILMKPVQKDRLLNMVSRALLQTRR
jgi:DNA-binding NtrC family response regulator